MSKRKIEAGKEIHEKRRSVSGDRRFSNSSRGRITSPSPNNKKDRWNKDNKDEKSLSNSVKSEQPNIPKGPHRRSINPSAPSLV